MKNQLFRLAKDGGVWRKVVEFCVMDQGSWFSCSVEYSRVQTDLGRLMEEVQCRGSELDETETEKK